MDISEFQLFERKKGRKKILAENFHVKIQGKPVV